MKRWVIVGLGNPGRRYSKSRHNCGFRVLDYLSARLSIPLSGRGYEYRSGEGGFEGEALLLVKPQTMMNRSGIAVEEIVDPGEGPYERLVVVHDDIDTEFARVRIKRGGGDGGHRGIRSIIDHLGYRDFTRVRIGVGRPPPGMDPSDYVLSPFLPEEEETLERETIPIACDAVLSIIKKGIEHAMNIYNRREGEMAE